MTREECIETKSEDGKRWLTFSCAAGLFVICVAVSWVLVFQPDTRESVSTIADEVLEIIMLVFAFYFGRQSKPS